VENVYIGKEGHQQIVCCITEAILLKYARKSARSRGFFIFLQFPLVHSICAAAGYHWLTAAAVAAAFCFCSFLEKIPFERR
jgi:hypothetical protein